jgi:murein DD-endopeptidase MepM/ murein hydrolase activator NlpD
VYFLAMLVPPRIAIAITLLYATRTADAQQHAVPKLAAPESPRLRIEPRAPQGGTLVRLTVDRLGQSGDSIESIRGSLADEPLHFIAADSGRFAALGAIPVDVSDSAVATVWVDHASGVTDTLRLDMKYPHHAPVVAAQSRGRVPGASRLRVDARFTRRMDDVTAARIEHENELARQIGRETQNTPKLFTLPFLRPRPSRVTSTFGSGRVFNGRVSSSHLGIDYRGSAGEPIYAANRGVVALVDSFFLAGNVVYLDHGDGVMTAYFHMTRQEVAVGDTVERGQEIGLVGATGRVTGPHLHWSARFGALTIDPANLLSLGAPFVERPPGEPETKPRKKTQRAKAKKPSAR